MSSGQRRCSLKADTTKSTRTILVVVEVAEEGQEPVLVPSQDCLDTRRFLGVGDKDLPHADPSSSSAGCFPLEKRLYRSAAP